VRDLLLQLPHHATLAVQVGHGIRWYLRQQIGGLANTMPVQESSTGNA